jgi:hypothetical protein
MIEVELDPKHYETALKEPLTDIVKDHPMLWKNPMHF